MTTTQKYFVPTNLDDISKEAFEDMMAKLKEHWTGSLSAWNDYYKEQSKDFERIRFFTGADIAIPLNHEDFDSDEE